jgi:hypothetical protein
LKRYENHQHATSRRAPPGRWSRLACTRCWRACTPPAASAAKDELDDALARLLPPDDLKGVADAARLLADAIAARPQDLHRGRLRLRRRHRLRRGLRGLRLLGARDVTYLVPDRVTDGYGLTPPIAQRVKALGARLLVTVDNGIASVEGVAPPTNAGPASAGDRPPPARPRSCRPPP